jgi:glutamate 5-kinase
MKIVVKVGTSTLAHKTGRLNIRMIETMCKVISDLKNAGHEIILVSSGAIGMGMGKLHLSERPRDTVMKQAAAAVGQCELMYFYDKLFSEYNHTVAQILLNADDLRCEERHKNFDNTMKKLLEMGVIPIINENDTVATEEIEIGDNDTLSAIVAVSVGADIAVLLSDIDGLYTANPKKSADAQLIPDVYELTDDVMALGGDAGSDLGTGGMVTKLRAAKIMENSGCDMIITNGARPEDLYLIADGKSVGTRFHSKAN